MLYISNKVIKPYIRYIWYIVCFVFKDRGKYYRNKLVIVDKIEYQI